MAYEIVVLEGAQRDIREIVNYLANALVSPQAASNFLDELDRQISLIKNNPNIFAISSTPELAKKNYHTAFINSYIMLYTIRETTAYIAHVFHQTQDYARLV